MVSELSKRLLRGRGVYGPSSARSSEDTRSKPFSDSSSTLSSDSSSREPERRAPVDEPPTRNSLLPRTRIENDPLGERDECFKRRKIDELTYAASRVREDLEKGGLEFASIHTDKPRALEGFDIDMSGVELLQAKSVADSPFLSNICGKRSFHNASEFEQLFSQTQQVYSKKWIQDMPSDWGERSSTGSLTSDSECTLTFDIPPRLEDALNSRSTPKESNHTLKTIAMGAAFENTSEPRLVTLSFAPFLVIHVNNAYTRMTGIEAKDVLGKPFRDVFKDKRCKSLASNLSSLYTMDDQLTSVYSRGQNKRSNCRLSISIVGTDGDSSPEKPGTITHYMIALEPVEETGLPSATNQPFNAAPTPAQGFGVHCEVMG